MNILIFTNFLGLHGSSIDLLIYAAKLIKNGHKIFVLGEDGDLKSQFKALAHGMYIKRNRGWLPSLQNILLLRKLIRQWNIEVIIGVGKFIALECQVAGLIFMKSEPILIMNFSPRRNHWDPHPKWHLPKVGFLAVNCQFYKEISIEKYNWPASKIYVLSARYDVTDALLRTPEKQKRRKKVLFVRRLDFPKYKSIVNSLDQLDTWGVWNQWSVEIAGGGTHEDRVYKKVNRIQLKYPDADIKLLGKRKDVIELMRNTDIVIGSERVAVEAISQGCLVILATDTGFIDIITPENIDKYNYDNFFAFNYEPGKIDQIKQKLFTVLGSTELWHDIIVGNFRYVKNYLDVKHGIKVLSILIEKSYAHSLRNREILIKLLNIIKSWISIYMYLFKDKLLGPRFFEE